MRQDSVSIAEEYCAELVRRHDRDRWLCALFAPESRRPALFALYAFNCEIARLRDTASEAILVEIRLHWWRDSLADTLAGRPNAQPVLRALGHAASAHDLTAGLFDRLLKARGRDLTSEAPASLAELVDYAEGSSASLMELAAQILGARGPGTRTAARHGGIAYALAGLMRAMPYQAAQGRSYLPRELMAGEGPSTANVQRAIVSVVGEAARHLEIARAERIEPAALPALLPASLAGLYLKRLRAARFDPASRRVDVSTPRKQVTLMMRAYLGRI